MSAYCYIYIRIHTWICIRVCMVRCRRKTESFSIYQPARVPRIIFHYRQCRRYVNIVYRRQSSGRRKLYKTNNIIMCRPIVFLYVCKKKKKSVVHLDGRRKKWGGKKKKKRFNTRTYRYVNDRSLRLLYESTRKRAFDNNIIVLSLCACAISFL